MTYKEKDPSRIQLKDVRLSYPSIWTARTFGNGEGEPAYSARIFIIDPETRLGKRNLDLIEEAIQRAKYRKWGNNHPNLKADKYCVQDGEKGAPEQEGMTVLRSRNLKKPLVLDGDRMETVE